MKFMNKGLTKHLYRIDEVLSSLRWSIINKHVYEAMFWGIEAYESDMLQDALDMLEHIWLTNIGFGSWFCFRLIQAIYNDGEINCDQWLSVISAFTRTEIRDSTIFHLLIRGAITCPTWHPRFPHSTDYMTISSAVSDCLRRGKLMDAWLLGRALDPSDQWAILTEIAKHKGCHDELDMLRTFRPNVYESLASAYVLVGIDSITWSSSKQQMDDYIPDEIQTAIHKWREETNMRKRRVLQVLHQAILYACVRSGQSSEKEIMFDLEATLKQSPYWANILNSYLKNDKWISDIKKEEFYDTHFPQDIPDEWSAEDRAKSHGPGLGLTEGQSRIQYILHTVQCSKSLELWGSKFSPELDCSMEWGTIYSDLLKSCFANLKPLFPKKPVTKKFEII